MGTVLGIVEADLHLRVSHAYTTNVHDHATHNHTRNPLLARLISTRQTTTLHKPLGHTPLHAVGGAHHQLCASPTRDLSVFRPAFLYIKIVPCISYIYMYIYMNE